MCLCAQFARNSIVQVRGVEVASLANKGAHCQLNLLSLVGRSSVFVHFGFVRLRSASHLQECMDRGMMRWRIDHMGNSSSWVSYMQS